MKGGGGGFSAGSGTRKGWFSRYQLLTVDNLAYVSVRCTGLLRPEEDQCHLTEASKRLLTVESWYISREPPLVSAGVRVSHLTMHALDCCLWWWVLMLCRAPSTLGTPSLCGARAYSSEQVGMFLSSSMCGATSLRVVLMPS